MSKIKLLIKVVLKKLKIFLFIIFVSLVFVGIGLFWQQKNLKKEILVAKYSPIKIFGNSSKTAIISLSGDFDLKKNYFDLGKKTNILEFTGKFEKKIYRPVEIENLGFGEVYIQVPNGVFVILSSGGLADVEYDNLRLKVNCKRNSKVWKINFLTGSLDLQNCDLESFDLDFWEMGKYKIYSLLQNLKFLGFLKEYFEPKFDLKVYELKKYFYF